MPHKKPGKRKDPPVFSFRRLQELNDRALQLRTQEESGNEPAPKPDPNAKKKTVFEQTLDKMDPKELRAMLDENMAKSLVPKDSEPAIDPDIVKQLERKTHGWRRSFRIDRLLDPTSSTKTGERKTKRFRRSLEALDDAASEDVSPPMPHDSDPGPSTNPTAANKYVLEQVQATDTEDLVVVGSSRDHA
ncbi:hypothetical protein FRC01_012290 [Tulasnella sp. 417]|nr:hypothetical protein FRC01_012290 [Tulasnella sp. 417]